MSRRAVWLGSVVLLALVVAATVGIPRLTSRSTRGLRLPGTVTTSETIAVSGTGGPGGAGSVVSSSSTAAPSSGGATPRSAGRPDTTRSSSPSSSKPAPPADPSERPAVDEPSFYLRVAWWNDTRTRPVRDFRLSVAGITWSADGSRRSAAATLGPLPVGKDLQLVVWPDGEGGHEMVVPFRIRSWMVSGSEQDEVHVEISDRRLRVLGNPVGDFERTFGR